MHRSSSQQQLSMPLSSRKTLGSVEDSNGPGLKSRKAAGASRKTPTGPLPEEEAPPDSLFVQGIEAIIELKGALHALEHGGNSELTLEQQAEARRVQRALRQAMHTAFFNQLAIAKNEAVDNNLKDGIDLHKGILKRSPGLPTKDKTAKGLELKASVESETPTNPILSGLANIPCARTVQSL